MGRAGLEPGLTSPSRCTWEVRRWSLTRGTGGDGCAHGPGRATRYPERWALELSCLPGPSPSPPWSSEQDLRSAGISCHVPFTLHTSPVLNFRSNLSL